MIRSALEKAIQNSLKSLGLPADGAIVLEHPAELSHGDYTTTIALKYFGPTSKVIHNEKHGVWTTYRPVNETKNFHNPRAFAEKIVAEILKSKPKEVEKVEVAGPGFINFTLSPQFFASATADIIKAGNKFGTSKDLKGAKTVVEYTDPNPFKEFHIGHLMSNSIGESISRIVEANGAKVKRACYQGDVGLHVAKAIYGMRLLALDKGIMLPEKESLEAKAVFLGKAYATGAQEPEFGQEKYKAGLAELNKIIYDRSDKAINKLYDWGRKISLDYFESIYKILGTKFAVYFFESKTGPFGKEIVEKNIGPVFEKGEKGSIIFPGEKYGLHTRVFINNEGLPTYEAKELGLSKIKYDKTKYDKSIIVTGNEINEYFKVLLKAMSLVFPDLAAKTSHVSHGMLRLPSGKMSSRTGDVITFMSLLSDVKEKVAAKMTDREMSEKERQIVIEQVAVGALKYAILRQVTGKDIIFDFEKSLSFEGDSGPYLQYSYARARSIIRKAKSAKVKPSPKKGTGEVSELEKMLYRFPEVVARAGAEYSPHYITFYLIELASSFNSFYAKNKIVDDADLTSPYKVALTDAFSIVLKNGLNLLGIAAPERM